MSENELTTASVLAFDRKLDPSDGIFSAGRWEDCANGESWPMVKVHPKSVRGTISNRFKGKGKDLDPAKLDASIQSPNLQTVDVAVLPNKMDTLRMRFTIRVLGGAGVPSACNNAHYQAKLQATVQGYLKEPGFGELARRYAVNLANARFLWRNRVGAEEVAVEIRHLLKGKPMQEWRFRSNEFSLRNFSVPANAESNIAQLSEVIAKGLSGSSYTILEVVAYARVGDGQEVYPSQELILDKGDKKGQKSKTLYTVEDSAAMHSQKIGNAVRTIDTWYPSEEGVETNPIAVEPYGTVTNQGKAYRQPRAKTDFYSMLDGWVLKGSAPALEGRHFVMANLIRGGVFGESDKE